jgi:phosphoserine phosphatase RsbU/P
MKTLIADDDVTSRVILASVMKKCGHEVVVTENGTQAWETLQQPDAPRLAILDWLMPELDGSEVCRRVRARAHDRVSYLILVTTRGDKHDIAEGLRAGADDYLTKPFSPVELSARIEVGCRMIELQDRLANQVRELEEALAQIRTLRGIVPICANCKKIRDDKGFWNQVEAYITAHSQAQFSHGLCPECKAQLYVELQQRAPNRPACSHTTQPG